MFSDKDIQQIQNKGMTCDQVNAQIKRLRDGMSYSNLVSAATIGKGIERYDDDEIKEMIGHYEANRNELSIVKFVPASGAASRMFKFLFQFLSNFDPAEKTLKNFIESTNNDLIDAFSSNLEKFPFYSEVSAHLKSKHPDYDKLSQGRQLVLLVKEMLDEASFNYSFLPKGLLPFHKYEDSIVTAFQEHLFESTLYASSSGHANLHFTVSEKHKDYFANTLQDFRPSLEDKTETKFNVSYSYQNEATETIALTDEDQVFRKKDGSILFRPGGHGALIENLNALDYDLIFVKNIDNIVVADKNIGVSVYKKLLAGVLLEAQQKVFSYLKRLDEGNLSEAEYKLMAVFLRYRLNTIVPADFDFYENNKKITYLKERFDRPIRVCGMVKNEGEPGGGPFWVKDRYGKISLQIVEFAQIDFRKSNQQEIVYKATHFNPTDLVCGVRNYKGEKYDLLKYVDPEAAFITMKTQNGVDIQALELPGLWNGSMAYWNSIFVEVPVETFNPVKTVNDLLKPVHQVS